MEIKFRRKDLVKTMRRVDPVYTGLAERLGESPGLAPLHVWLFDTIVSCTLPLPPSPPSPPPSSLYLPNNGWERRQSHPARRSITRLSCHLPCSPLIPTWSSEGPLGPVPSRLLGFKGNRWSAGADGGGRRVVGGGRVSQIGIDRKDQELRKNTEACLHIVISIG